MTGFATANSARFTRRHKWGLRILSLVVVLGAWELFGRALNSLLFPTASEALFAFAQLVIQPYFWNALWISNQALIIGFSFAVVAGILLGLAMGRSPSLEKVVNPYLSIMLATPITALIPILILAVGFGLPARSLVVFFFSLVVIVVNTRTGLRTLDAGWIEMARSFGASEAQIWQRVLLPGTLPAIMTGLRLGLGRALTGMVAVELTLVAVGIGRLLMDYQGMFEAGYVYATILGVMLEAIILLSALRWLEKRVAPWNVTAQKQ